MRLRIGYLIYFIQIYFKQTIFYWKQNIFTTCVYSQYSAAYPTGFLIPTTVQSIGLPNKFAMMLVEPIAVSILGKIATAFPRNPFSSFKLVASIVVFIVSNEVVLPVNSASSVTCL